MGWLVHSNYSESIALANCRAFFRRGFTDMSQKDELRRAERKEDRQLLKKQLRTLQFAETNIEKHIKMVLVPPVFFSNMHRIFPLLRRALWSSLLSLFLSLLFSSLWHSTHVCYFSCALFSCMHTCVTVLRSDCLSY